MRTALALLSAIPLLAFGCGRPVVPVMAATAPPAPKLQIKPVPFLNEVTSSPESTNVAVQWEAIIAQFPVDAIERLGFTKLFETVGEKNAIIDAENTRSELVQLARTNSNVVLNLASGAYAGSCTFEESTNLLQELQQVHADILSSPRLTTKGTGEGIISVSDVQTIVLGGVDKTDPKAILTKSISLGLTISLRLLSRSADKIAVEAGARLEEFGGYEGKSSNVARPILSVTTMGTRAELNTNEVLLLGGPIRMKIFKSSESVAYLSKIPAVGRLFTKTQMHTNFVRTLVIVRPRLLE